MDKEKQTLSIRNDSQERVLDIDLLIHQPSKVLEKCLVCFEPLYLCMVVFYFFELGFLFMKKRHPHKECLFHL